MKSYGYALVLLSILWYSPVMLGAEKWTEIPYAQTKPPGPPKSPSEAQASFIVPPGFRIELAAAEPQIVNPVAMTWDDRGRIWVCESVQYPRNEPRPGKDRIRILEDTNGDGKMDSVKTFAEELNIPSGIAIGYGGVFVSNAPEILFLKDIDGDDVADRREVILDGFGTVDTHELPNTFTWGPDGWLYGLNGVFNPSKVTHQGKTWEFTCALWRYHPVTKAFEVYCEGTSNPWGLVYNANGHWFVSACVVDHLWHLTQTGYYHRQGGPYPPNVWKIESIVDHRHHMQAYCGLGLYDADVYPEEFRGDLFMGNIHGNCINRDRLSRRGSTYHAEGMNDFLNTDDVWFMPVSTQVGPDGCFWVLDWYDRYHCHQDAGRDPDGIDRQHGRLWRVAYGDVPSPKPFDLSRKSDQDLISLLSHPNGWWRRKAQRILVERNHETDVEPLEALVRSSAPNNAPMHAVWTLMGMKRIGAGLQAELLEHGTPAMRAWGVRNASETGDVSDEIFKKLGIMAKDPSPDVRLEVAIASSRIGHPDSFRLLLDVLSYETDDPLIPHITWENLHPRIDSHRREMAEWIADENHLKTEGARAVSQRAIGMLVPRSAEDAEPFNKLFSKAVNHESNSFLLAHCLDALWKYVRDGSDAAGDRGRDFLSRELREDMSRLIARDDGVGATAIAILTAWGDESALKRARVLAGDPQQAIDARQQWLRALAIAQDASLVELIGAVLKSPGDSIEFKRHVLEAAEDLDHPAVGHLLVEVWSDLPSELHATTIGVLCSRAAWSTTLLQAVEAGRISKSELNVTHVRRMNDHNQPELSAAVERTWGLVRAERDPNRRRVIRRMTSVIRGEKGDAANGQRMFNTHCASCHKIYGHGSEVGPDITGTGRTDLDQILSNVLDPNLVIGSGYVARTVWTHEGQVFNGLLVEDSPERVVLKVAGGGEEQVIPREEIEEMRVSQVSFMPEGLEEGMTEQEFRDLVAFLLTKEPPLPWHEVTNGQDAEETPAPPAPDADSGAP